jgi:hypothetical protein
MRETSIIKINYNNIEYEIEKIISEYVVDEPAGGGKSVLYKSNNGIPCEAFLLLNDAEINKKFISSYDKKGVLINEYEYHKIWNWMFTDEHYYILISDELKNKKEYKIIDLDVKKSQIPKF